MIVNDLRASLHIAPKLEQVIDSNGEEIPQGLPPGAIPNVYAVDEYPGCPNTWMNGSNIASSYFLEVKEERGMWLNFNNCATHNHDVAVVVSIQGVNPITGQKMVGDNPLRLEKYHKQCPIHSIDFKQDRFCEECGYKWPNQNYISTTGTPSGLFWIDGFRNSDGSVRQYIFTEEESKGIASQVIGSDRVFAIGIAFYLSKEAKPVKSKTVRGRNVDYGPYVKCASKPAFFSPIHTPQNWNTGSAGAANIGYANSGNNFECQSGPSASSGEDTDSLSLETNSADCLVASAGLIPSSALNVNSSAPPSDVIEEVVAPVDVIPAVPVKKLEVGAGALIDQKIYSDTKDMDYWNEKPAGMIYINYCDAETLKNILAKGRRKEKVEGFMDGLKVGS